MPSETFARLAALAPRERRADANPASPREDPARSLPSAIDLERDFGLFATDVVAHHASSSSSSSSSPSPACAPAVDARGVVSCACAGCARWRAFCEGALDEPAHRPARRQYEVLTREHVGALAAYIHSRANALVPPPPPAPGSPARRRRRRALRVLEVGAGDGRLATHVRAAIDAIEQRREGGRGEDEDVPRVAIVAVDDDSLGLRRPRDDGALLRFVTMDAIEALAPGALVFPGDDGDGGDPGDRPGDRPGDVSPAPGPDLVLACWQPMGVDWTAAMRANASVAEYVLVGEADDGMCGRPWETWGYAGWDGDIPGDGDGDIPGDGDGTPPVPPYVRDGFERGDVAGVSGASQICRADERWRGTRRSRTVSFRRVTGPGAVGGGRGRSGPVGSGFVDGS